MSTLKELAAAVKRGRPGALDALLAAIDTMPEEELAPITQAVKRRDAAETAARELYVAAQAFKESLGEYVRQSMYFNPEWSNGLKTLDAALTRHAQWGKP